MRCTFCSLLISFLPVESARHVYSVYSGREVAETLPAIKISVWSVYRTRMGKGGLRERNLVM